MEGASEHVRMRASENCFAMLQDNETLYVFLMKGR